MLTNKRWTNKEWKIKCARKDKSYYLTIIKYIKEGHALAETGKKFGLSRERIRQIASKHGVDINLLIKNNLILFRRSVPYRMCAECLNEFNNNKNKRRLFCCIECRLKFKIRFSLHNGRYTVLNGKSIIIARKVVQDCLGVKLSRKECVHHIDGNIKNNHIDNLIVLDRKKHASMHQQERKKKNLQLQA